MKLLFLLSFTWCICACSGELGFKGAQLCELVRLNVPVPNGFIISTKTSSDFQHHPDKTEKIKEVLLDQCRIAIHDIETCSNKKFGKAFSRENGDDTFPLLVSVRASTLIHLPGATKSVINIGMNDVVVEEMARLSGDPRWAYDMYRLFIQTYGEVVIGVASHTYHDILQKACASQKVSAPCDLSIEALKQVVVEFKLLSLIPHDPFEQLVRSIAAVFHSWTNANAMRLRDVHDVPESCGTAVIVQEMVFGNLSDKSGAGIAVSRNPLTGIKEVSGEYLPSAMGLDLIDRQRSPVSLHDLRMTHPRAHDKILFLMEVLEAHFRDAQAVEFVVEEGSLYILHCRKARRTARAALHIAAAMVQEGLISERQALMRIEPRQMSYFLHAQIDPRFLDETNPEVKKILLGRGHSVSSGVVTGKAVFSATAALQFFEQKEPCVLFITDAAELDIATMKAANGIVCATATFPSGIISALRGMTKPTVCCVPGLNINTESREVNCADFRGIRAGDDVTVDGNSGMIYKGEVPSIAPQQDMDYFREILRWADKYKRVAVNAVVSSVDEALTALELGADGVGLFHTDLMFEQPDCLDLTQKLLLASGVVERQKYLKALFPLHREVFLNLFRLLEGKSVKIVLLDALRATLLPFPESQNYQHTVKCLSQSLNISVESCAEKMRELQCCENPALGVQGTAVSVLGVDITSMQVGAIVHAIQDAKLDGISLHTSIVIPQSFSATEITSVGALVNHTASLICEAEHCSTKHLQLSVGAMLATPRACFVANRLHHYANDFVVLDMNRLTELTLGLSKEDAWRKLCSRVPKYLRPNLFVRDPFQQLDTVAVVPLLQLAVTKFQEINKRGQVEVTGDHCGDVDTMRYLALSGVSGLSTEPHKVPMAKLAAAQAKIQADSGRDYLQILGDSLEMQRMHLL
jgi:pyruvate,orthophosphate dikinase